MGHSMSWRVLASAGSRGEQVGPCELLRAGSPTDVPRKFRSGASHHPFGRSGASTGRRVVAQLRSRSRGELEQRIPRLARRPLAIRAASAPINEKGYHRPSGMEDEAGEQHKLTRQWADRGPLPDVSERRDRGGVDEQLADVARHLNEEDPTVVPPQAPPCRLEEGNVEVRGLIILVENLIPAVIDAWTLPAAGWDRRSRLPKYAPAFLPHLRRHSRKETLLLQL
jgi:hypothetical protein